MKRILFFLVIPAAVIAALASRSRRVEAPEGGVESAEGSAVPLKEPTAPGADPLGIKTAVDAVRQHAQDAMQAAHDAQAQTELELRAQFEASRRKQP